MRQSQLWVSLVLVASACGSGRGDSSRAAEAGDAAAPAIEVELFPPAARRLLALPALLANGLLKHCAAFFRLPAGFYSLFNIFLLLAFLALARIKSVEGWVREIRKLSAQGHQTAVLATDYCSPMERLAPAMFARWSQENFFKYMRENFNLDRLKVKSNRPRWRNINCARRKRPRRFNNCGRKCNN